MHHHQPSNHSETKQLTTHLLDFSGRLGNQMSSLATMLSINWDHNLVPLVTSEQKEFLTFYFDPESLRVEEMEVTC